MLKKIIGAALLSCLLYVGEINAMQNQNNIDKVASIIQEYNLQKGTPDANERLPVLLRVKGIDPSKYEIEAAWEKSDSNNRINKIAEKIQEMGIRKGSIEAKEYLPDILKKFNATKGEEEAAWKKIASMEKQIPETKQDLGADIGIIACLDPAIQKELSFGVDTTNATVKLKNAETQNYIYWLDRKKSDTYHITLDMFHKSNGNFSSNEVAFFEDFLKKFIIEADNLKIQRTKFGHNYYNGNVYELRLFVHYTDGTSRQFKSNDISQLLQSNKDVAYANLVLKIGTFGGLTEDWESARKKIFQTSGFESARKHDLETHITIATIYKYGKDINGIVNGKVQRTDGRSPINTHFKGGNKNEMQLLVDTFKSTNEKFITIKIPKIDCLQITNKKGGEINVIKTIKFDDAK